MEKITSINEKGKIFKTSIYSDGLKYQRRKIYINKGIYKIIDLDSEKNLTRTRHYSNGILESESILEGKNLITKNFNTKGEVKESILENFNTGEKLTQKYENSKLKSQSLEFREKLGVKYKEEYKRTFNDKGEIEKEAYAGFYEVRNFFKNVLSRMFDEEKRGETIREAVDKYSEKIKKERDIKTVDEIEFFRNEIIKKYDKWSNLVFEKEKTYDGEIIQKKYYENGKLKEEYRTGKSEDEWDCQKKKYDRKEHLYYEKLEYLPKGELEHLANEDQMNKREIYYYPNGNIQKEIKELDGTTKEYYENNKLKFEKQSYGSTQDVEKHYTPKGELKLKIKTQVEKEHKFEIITSYDGDNIKNVNYYKNNILQKNEEYKNGSKSEENYYENGKLENTISYNKNTRVSTKYYENGNVETQEIYRKVKEIGSAKLIENGIGYQQSSEKSYYKNGNIKQELEYKPFMNSYFSDEGVGVIQRKEALPVKEKKYNEAGKLINEKTNEYQKQDGVFELKKSIEIDYKNGFKIEEKIREYENSGMTLTNEKINNYEKEKVIKKLDNGTYQVEFWHNKIAFERAIYPNENINDHKPLEQKIYENGKLYSETYFSYEKNEELNTVYNENGEKKLKSVANFNEGIRIMENYFEGTEQVSKREYLEANTYELEKQEIFNKKGQLIERSTWDEGELVLKKKYNEKEQITKRKIVINKTSKIEKQGIVDRNTRERSREKVRGNEK
ncbi:hypothetical protein [Cetobacterium sp.]|uniref:hypothetical protein n=1 Tax=Cetobacterium sp. TaxID=2071632 RepID=UPI003F2BD5A8